MGRRRSWKERRRKRSSPQNLASEGSTGSYGVNGKR